MSTPLVCTNNSLGNYDYGIPITATKCTDYRTSTGTYHRLVPNVPQEFDCRVKAKIKPKLLEWDVTVRDETADSLSHFNYVRKFPKKGILDDISAPIRLTGVHYVKTVQEKIFKNPPPPKATGVSVMKESYTIPPLQFNRQEIFPPELHAKCEIKALGRDEQPGIPPEAKGYYKYLDPYLTTARLDHVPFTLNQLNGVAKKDIITFYDISKYPKAKGFGPREKVALEPVNPNRKIPMLDKTPFKLHPIDRRVRTRIQPLPNKTDKFSEYSRSYVKQCFSDLYPYLFQSTVQCPQSISNASAWQNLAAPGMYCSEYCHIGTGWPVNSVVDYASPVEPRPHKQCFTKFCDWS